MGFFSAADTVASNHIVKIDYLLPMSGEQQLQRWTHAQLQPYVLYLHDAVTIDACFGGLYFSPILSSSRSVVSAKGIGFGKPPSIEAWEEAIRELFLPGFNISAAMSLTLERPFQKELDIWIELPYPLETSQSFGVLQEQPINFALQPEGRMVALSWWIDQVMENCAAINITHPASLVKLRGFVWAKSSIPPTDKELIKRVAEKIHALQLQFLWSMNYGSGEAIHGYEYGFDIISLRSTYMGQGARGIDWMKSALHFADVYHFGVTVWGDERVSPYQTLDFLNTVSDFGTNIFHIYDLPILQIYEWYHNKNPLYVYVYAFSKGAYGKILRPALQ